MEYDFETATITKVEKCKRDKCKGLINVEGLRG